VPRGGQQIDLQFLDVDRYFTDRLRGIEQKQSTLLPHEGADFRRRLDDARNIRGMHQRD